MSNEAEIAWQKYAGRLGVAKPIPGTRDWNDERAAFVTAFAAGAEWQASRKLGVTDDMVKKGVGALVASWDGTVSTPDDWDLVRSILTAALNGGE